MLPNTEPLRWRKLQRLFWADNWPKAYARYKIDCLPVLGFITRSGKFIYILKWLDYIYVYYSDTDIFRKSMV
jgi:hypothetical protein